MSAARRVGRPVLPPERPAIGTADFTLEMGWEAWCMREHAAYQAYAAAQLGDLKDFRYWLDGALYWNRYLDRDLAEAPKRVGAELALRRLGFPLKELSPD